MPGGRVAMQRAEQQQIAAVMRTKPDYWTVRQHAYHFNLTLTLARSILERFEIPFRREGAPEGPQLTEDAKRARAARDVERTMSQLRLEIAAVKAEWPTVKPFRIKPSEWYK